MKCFDFASRLQLVPLPTDLQTLVQQYLGHAPIPSSTRKIKDGFTVVQMHKDEMYYRHGWKLFHHDKEIADDWQQCLGNLTQVQKNWILLDYTLVNTETNHRRVLPYSGEPAVLYQNAIFVIKDSTLYRLPLQHLGYSTVSYDTVQCQVKSMQVIGKCLNLVHTNGSCSLFGPSGKRYTDCKALYRWRYNIYKISRDGVCAEDNTVIFRFVDCMFMNIFARDEWLFVEHNNLCYYACNFMTMAMYHWQDTMRLELSNDDRLFAQNDTTLYIF